MKNLIKLAIGLALVLPFAASAATISNPLFSNGQTSTDATGGSTVSGTFTLTVGPGEVVEWLRTQADTQQLTDTSVGGTLGYQEGVYTNVPFSAKVALNTGNYNVWEQGAGTYGGNRSINGGDNVVVGPVNLGTVRVTASGSDTTTGGPVVGSDDFWTKLAALLAGILKTNQPPAPTKPVYCASLASYAGVSYGMTGPQVSALQNLLISSGFSIPAGATGSYFNQTLAAHNSAKMACN